jgi:hypothetical protein
MKNFILWPWVVGDYYYAAIYVTLIRVAGGVISAIFRLIGDKSLYKLSQIEGFVR